MIDKRNTLNENNAQTQRERDTAADMDETRADGDDDDEGGNSEDDHGESMRMRRGARLMGQTHRPNGDRLTVWRPS